MNKGNFVKGFAIILCLWNGDMVKVRVRPSVCLKLCPENISPVIHDTLSIYKIIASCFFSSAYLWNH